MVSSSPPSPTSPIDKKKPSFGGYYPWLKQNHHADDLEILETHYDMTTRIVAETYQKSAFWDAIIKGLINIDAQYLVDRKYPLIADFSPTIVIKPWRSFFEKTYRKNISYNEKFPEPPEGGWVTPDNWYGRIHDIVRTSIIVKYLDGVPLMVEFLRGLAAQHGLQFDGELEARVDGYYGAHCGCGMDCEISTLDWKKVQHRIVLEIQVTTSIKDVIKRLLHGYYETRRLEIGPVSIKELSWNYKSDEFIASYLGHILHYVEGMILDVRDRKRG